MKLPTLTTFRIDSPPRPAGSDTRTPGATQPASPVNRRRHTSFLLEGLRKVTSALTNRKAAGGTLGTTGPAMHPTNPVRTSAGPEARPKVNALASGQKIDCLATGHDTIDTLQPHEIDALAVALHLVKPGETGNHQSDTMAIRQRLGCFARDLEDNLTGYNEDFLELDTITHALGDAGVAELRALMHLTHMSVKSLVVQSANGPHAMLSLYFDGTQNWRDVRQDASTALGRAGQLDRATCRIAELMSGLVAPEGRASLVSVSGMSMGGGAAQIFMASVDSRVALACRPAVILLDPVLLNDRQAALAVKDGTRPVDFSQPRGVAITLDYAKKPQRGLMSKMKTLGYHSPGIVRLKLGLEDGDGQRYGDRKPKPAPIGLGYHGRAGYYAEALRRFSGLDAAMPGGQAAPNSFTVTSRPVPPPGHASVSALPPAMVSAGLPDNAPAMHDDALTLQAEFGHLAPLIT